MNFVARLARFREAASLEELDAAYISSLANIRYLSGFSGSAGILVVKADGAVLVTDGRYEEAARELCQASDVEVAAASSDQQFAVIERILTGCKRLLLDPSQVTMDSYEQLKKSMPAAELVYMRQLIERLRLTKDSSEVARIRAACKIALQAFAFVPEWLGGQYTERLIAHKLEASMKELGAEDIAFATIVASGPNSAKPHHHPSDRVPQEGEPVIIDFGAVVDGYCCDIARTVWSGELRKEYVSMHQAAVAAYTAGVGSVGVGVPHSDVDAACRKSFELYGFTDKPLHPSGHSVGLSIHERPFLTPYATDEIGEGYVLTVEPGLYRPGVAGFRFEDTLLVHTDGVEVLSDGKE